MAATMGQQRRGRRPVEPPVFITRQIYQYSRGHPSSARAGQRRAGSPRSVWHHQHRLADGTAVRPHVSPKHTFRLDERGQSAPASLHTPRAPSRPNSSSRACRACSGTRVCGAGLCACAVRGSEVGTRARNARHAPRPASARLPSHAYATWVETSPRRRPASASARQVAAAVVPRRRPPSAWPARSGWTTTSQEANPEVPLLANPAVNAPLEKAATVKLAEELPQAEQGAARSAQDPGTPAATQAEGSPEKEQEKEKDEEKEQEKEQEQEQEQENDEEVAEPAGPHAVNAVRQTNPCGRIPEETVEGRDSPVGSLKGRSRPVSRQMTLARSRSPGESVKPAEDQRAGGATVWVGGIPSRLALDEPSLRNLLAHHGGGGDSSHLLSLTLRLKQTDDVDANRSWCLASFLNGDAHDNLAQAVAAARSEERVPSANDAGSKPGGGGAGRVQYDIGVPELPSSLIIKPADVPRQLFVRKLGSIHAGKLVGWKMMQQEEGQLVCVFLCLRLSYCRSSSLLTGAGAGGESTQREAAVSTRGALGGINNHPTPQQPRCLG